MGLMLALATVLVAMAAGLGSTSPANGASQYFSGVIPPEWVLSTTWNYWTYNEAVNCFCNGPVVGIKQKHPDGLEDWYRTAAGNIDICHSTVYSQTLCANLSSYSISLSCYRQTTPC